MFLFFLVLIAFCFIVYRQIFSGFFFMDDFYFLQISQANNLKEFINLFKPIRFIPYRPISQQLFFFSFQKIFGLNPLPYHIFIFIIHILSSLLVYKISFGLFKNSLKAKMISLIYVISPIHFVGLYSITGSYFLFGAFFFLASFWFWLRFKNEQRNSFYLFSFITFFLGIFSSEIVAVLPLIIFIIFMSKKVFLRLIPYFIVIGGNLLINFLFAGAPKTQAFEFKLAAFPSLFRWYLLRAFGLPEGVKNGNHEEIIIIYFLFCLSLIIILSSLIIKRRLIKKDWPKIIKYFLWIIIAAFPFYFMPNHLNPIYFSLSFVGFLLLLEKMLPQKLFFVYSVIFIILSFLGVRLLMHTHWIVRRSQLAKNWIEKIKKTYPNSYDNIIVLYLPDDYTREELRITLKDNMAFQLFYNNKNLKTLYQIK